MNEEKAQYFENTSLLLMDLIIFTRWKEKIKTKIFLKTKLKPNDLKHSTHNF